MSQYQVLNNLLKGKSYAVGTMRTWSNGDYVKHADGWVKVGGAHHGKLMGKFKSDATHAQYASENSVKVIGIGSEKKQEPSIEDLTAKLKAKGKELKAENNKKSEANKKKINAITEEFLAEEAGKSKPKLGSSAKTAILSDKVNSKNSDREVRLRGLSTGKPSKEAYKSPEGSKVNLTDTVSFGKASQAVQKDLNKMLFESEVVLDSMGVQMKKPLDFVCQPINAVKRTQATFTSLKDSYDSNDRIDIKDRSSGLNKSLIHEIGHAIDYSMTDEGTKSSLFAQAARASRNIKADKNSDSYKDFTRLQEILKDAPFYKDRSDKSYLTDPTEIFARSFEVVAYKKAIDLNKQGKISDDYINAFHPDFLKGSKKEAGMGTMNADKTIDMLKEKGFKKEHKELKSLKAEYEKNMEVTKDYRAKMNTFFSAQNAGTNTPADVEAGRKNKTLFDASLKTHKKLQNQLNRDIDKHIITLKNNIPQREDAEAVMNEVSEIMERVLKLNPIKKAMQNLELRVPLEKGNDIEHDYHKFYVGLVVVNSKGEVLLGKRLEDGIWTGPGGGSEKGESPQETAVREAFEEAQLEVDSEQLIELDTLEAGDGKKVHCFLYYTGQKYTSPSLDPDEEVKKWTWYAQKDIPKDLTKDSNRHMAVMNGLMTLKGLKKAQETELNTILKGGTRAPIGAVHNGMQKIAEGKWVPVKEAKPQNDPAASDPEATHHQDEAQRHMGEAAKYKELSSKLKEKIKHRMDIDPNYKVPAEAQTLLDESEAKMKIHAEDYKSKNKTAQSAQEDVKASGNADTMKESKKNHASKEETRKLEEGHMSKDKAEGKAANKRETTAKDDLDSKVKKRKVSKSLIELNNILKGRMQIAMQDHEKHEQFQADKMKEGTEAIARPELDKGGPGSGPKKANTHEEKQSEKNAAYDRIKAKYAINKDPVLLRQLEKLQREMQADSKFGKSTIDMGHETAINTADYAITESSSKDWLEQFREKMSNYNYGDAPRSLQLTRGYSIMMSKVDDGLYSGFVTQSRDRDGEELQENVGKVEKQTIPDMIQYLKAREYIMPEVHSEAVERVEEDLEAEKSTYGGNASPGMGMAADGLANSQAPSDSPIDGAEMAMNDNNYKTSDRTIKFMELLDRVLNGL